MVPALILVPEPYYNEAGYESRKQQTEMADRSKRYNETATINSLEYLLKVLSSIFLKRSRVGPVFLIATKYGCLLL